MLFFTKKICCISQWFSGGIHTILARCVQSLYRKVQNCHRRRSDAYSSLKSGDSIQRPRGLKSRSLSKPLISPSCSRGVMTTLSEPLAITSNAATRKSAGPTSASPTMIDEGRNVLRSIRRAAARRSEARNSVGRTTPTGRSRKP